ncbi:MAG: alpha-amylase family glycosyl hydrolase [Myxococcales bacterium]
MTTSQLAERYGDGTGICKADGWLSPYSAQLRERQARFAAKYAELEQAGGLLERVSLGHQYFGLNRGEREGERGIWVREWAPGATRLSLVGDFNGWDREAHRMERDPYGVFSLFLPDRDGKAVIPHGSRVKVSVVSRRGTEDRVPAYIRRTLQDPDNHDFSGQYWQPAEPYEFRHPVPPLPPTLRIYEAHVGMASEEGKVATFAEFTRDVLPMIAALGYNTVQLMAVMEHPYYGSFGYHVSSFFAVSSRFGTPEELKQLIDEAHGLGIRVLLDLVHSHAVSNTREGLNLFDGTDHQYFHAPPRGVHEAWDSMVFDYAKFEVLRFLLSNTRYWLEEFRFDGFRFDGITSMLYLDHGLGKSFSSYDDYFGANVDEDAVTYLKLTNVLVHALRPQATSIAEDMSGMPGMARPVSEGGLGFDYRLAMGVPDYWIKLVKERRDESWSLAELYGAMLNRRRDEKHVAYVESHDQALVGDQTIAFRLMGAEMYWHMQKGDQNLAIDRGIALHKMIRLFTFLLAGEAWLNFMGNEFGHPEWVDFPREGNHWSFHHARRQWSLATREDLRYRGLLRFDQALADLDEDYGVLRAEPIEQLMSHEENKIIAVRRGPVVCAFNFHAQRSYKGLAIPVPDATDYRAVLDSDAHEFEGFERLELGALFPLQPIAMYGRKQSVQLYLPSRTAVVMVPSALMPARRPG